MKIHEYLPSRSVAGAHKTDENEKWEEEQMRKKGYKWKQRCRYFMVNFNQYQGIKLRDCPEPTRTKLMALMLESVQQMVPAPDRIYSGDIDFTAQWSRPGKTFVKQYEDEELTTRIEQFVRSNTVAGFDRIVIRLGAGPYLVDQTDTETRRGFF